MSIQTCSRKIYGSVNIQEVPQEKMALDRLSGDVNFLRDAIWSRAPKYSIFYIENDLYASIKL